MSAARTAREADGAGAWITQVRARTGLSARELGRRAGLSLWDVERLEAGRPAPGDALQRIAVATDIPLPRVVRPLPTSEREDDSAKRLGNEADARPAASDRAIPTLPDQMAARFVMGSVILLIVVRFFTEKIHVLPGAMNFVDVPLFFALILATLLVGPATHRASFGLAAPTAAFTALCIVSVFSNMARIDAAPVLMFMYGFLSPVVVFWAVHRIWPTGRALTFSRLLVGLGLIQFLAVLTLDVPNFVSSANNPDYISGTFGENPYQLVFYLLVFMALLAGISTFERGRVIARFVPVLLVATFAVIFIAQYRSLLVTTALTVLALGYALSIGRPRGFLLSVVAGAALLVTLSYTAQAFPRLKFTETIAEFTSHPTYYATERLKILEDIWSLYGDNSRYVITGTGPGTYSSRAWETFSDDAQRQKNTAGKVASKLLGGQSYSTDVSQYYVIPRRQSVISGSHAVTTPQASWPSLLGEVGVFGALLIAIIYGRLFLAVLRRTRIALRTRRQGDAVPALLLAAATAVFVLVQMGSLENWLEVTRVTFLTAAVAAIAIKEFDAAHEEIA